MNRFEIEIHANPGLAFWRALIEQPGPVQSPKTTARLIINVTYF